MLVSITRYLLAAILITVISRQPSFATESSVIMYPDHPAISYTGRIDFSDPKKPVLSWPGTYIKTRFSGTSLSIELDDIDGLNAYNVILNGDEDNPVVIFCNSGRHTYSVFSDLNDTVHEIEIHKRTEGWEGETQFIGLHLEHGKTLYPAEDKYHRRIEFYGDSLTSGLGNMAPIDKEDTDPKDKNNYLSYASITARALNAEHHIISLSGIGVMASWFDFVMPDYFTQLSASQSSTKRWDFTIWKPDVVVINLMQNDYWLIENERQLKLSDSQIIKNYQNFVEQISTRYPTSHFLLMLGSMDVVDNAKWVRYVEQAAINLEQRYPNQKFSTLILPRQSLNAHPRYPHHERIAKLVTKEIRRLMEWN
ncbi:SGNH/GDSL hydrolase family protein [Vibrio sp. WXL103]|uniref:SGNH/GDSL hydrolase family protein n=1 Tax=Vibrio sp. WXL103 TaxID=3450710 RepID=UPI003EC4AC18